MNGNQLKWLAIFSMTVDHIGYILVPSDAPLYGVCRLIGRLAFPLFCFLLSEGLYHTKSRARYLARLALFALFSEIPFDLAFHSTVLEFGGQNIFFTLVLGLLGLVAFDKLFPKLRFCALAAPLLSMLLAEGLYTDYGALGVLFITVCYLLRKNRYVQMGGMALTNILMSLDASNRQFFGCAAVIPVFLYNGQRGGGGKWNQYFFYVFYPLHLTLLWGVSVLIG